MTFSAPVESFGEKSVIDLYLEEQRTMTAVDKFARHHESPSGRSSRSSYRDLIPLGAPEAGQQYAFEVDLDSCSGCKACVTACHSLNGLDEGETWRSIGLLQGVTRGSSWQQTITTACHHCLDPECLNGCPVLAYEKDPSTGIVRHLDDQCIGCQYCVMKCPYDVPKYSARKGIVRKCDMCSQRLSEGEAPACAQACPSQAIRIRIVEKSGVFSQYPLVPTAPSSRITQPTTRYIRRNPLPNDGATIESFVKRSAPGHLPLVFMLVLTQASVGILTLAPLISKGSVADGTRHLLDGICGVTAWLGILFSVLHLGRPQHAWRAFLGFKRSWLSREIVFFGAYLAMVTPLFWMQDTTVATQLWRPLAVGVGWVGVGCSSMVYHDTSRDFWRLRYSATKFIGTSLLAGLAALNLERSISGGAMISSWWLPTVLLAAAVIKLSGEAGFLLHAGSDTGGPLKNSALAMLNELGVVTKVRFGLGLCGIGCIMAQAYSHGRLTSIALGLGGLAMLLGGELLERFLFFKAVAPLRMPGALP